MKHFEVLGHVETLDVLASLPAREKEFDRITLRQDAPGSPHKDTRSIFLRGPAVDPATEWQHDVPHIDYAPLEDWPEMLGLLRARWGHVGDAVGKIMVIDLKPGGALAWHTDEGSYAETHLRYHLPLVTNPMAFMYSGGETAHLPVGCLTRFDNRTLHSAANFGQTRRIHLVVDIRR